MSAMNTKEKREGRNYVRPRSHSTPPCKEKAEINLSKMVNVVRKSDYNKLLRCDVDEKRNNANKKENFSIWKNSVGNSDRYLDATQVDPMQRMRPQSMMMYSKCGSRSQSARSVPAFSPSSRMKDVVVIGPPKLGIFKPRPSRPTTFRKMYERGDVPVTLHHDHRGHSLRWKVDLDKLDYHHYLPLFFDGLRETTHPYDFFSRAGVRDLLSRGGEKVLPVVPQLILPLKSALNTRQPRVICTVLHVLQELVASSPPIGESLVPFYRQLLPTLNLFRHRNLNLGDEIDYSQRRQENIGDLIQDTLEMMERRGGRDAYINIKYMVPTYQSCIIN